MGLVALLRRSAPAWLASIAAVCPLQAQFTMQDSGTTADLRGIVNVGNGTAWASGTHGTVLRTEDSGFVWQGCTVPPGAEQLDFRGIQAFDDQTAIVMSSGKGDLSRVYKTTDGCKSWKLVFTNPDADGFFDAIVSDRVNTTVLGDPVRGRFTLLQNSNGLLDNWHAWKGEAVTDEPIYTPHSTEEAIFAASNSSLQASGESNLTFVTGGKGGSYFYGTEWHLWPLDFRFQTASSVPLPFPKSESAGAFSFATSCKAVPHTDRCVHVAVGGDYKKPGVSESTAAWAPVNWSGGGLRGRFQSSKTMPHGYRSSVAYDARSKTWITVGPNGTDVSTDDGRNWRALKPGYGDDPNADKQWNALSLPYVVGPHGRIGRLRDDALTPGK